MSSERISINGEVLMNSEYFFELIDAALRNDKKKMMEICRYASSMEWSHGQMILKMNVKL